jgi:hypothetical protein
MSWLDAATVIREPRTPAKRERLNYGESSPVGQVNDLHESESQMLHVISQLTQPIQFVQPADPVQSFSTVLHDLAEIAGVIALGIGGLAAWLTKNHGTKIEALAGKIGVNEQSIAKAEGVAAGVQRGMTNLETTARSHDAQLTAVAGIAAAAAKGVPLEASAIAKAFEPLIVPVPQEATKEGSL